MAVELKDVLSVLSIEDIEDINQFSEKFNKNFVSRSVAIEDEEIKSKVTGKMAGGLTTLLKREFALENKEIEGKKLEEIIELGMSKQKTKITELEVNATKGLDEKVTEWQTKAEKAKKEALEYKTQLDSTLGAFDDLKNGFESEKKGWSISAQYNEGYKKLQSVFSEDVLNDTLKIEGFNSLIAKKYKFDLDENNSLFVTDKEGSKIQNPDKIGTWLTPEEVLKKEATENKMVKLNDAGKGLPASPVKKKIEQQAGEGNAFKVHPNVARFGLK